MADIAQDTATARRTFRLGDRVMFRVPSAHKRGKAAGDIIGIFQSFDTADAEKVLVGWADGSQSWELVIELRLASEQ